MSKPAYPLVEVSWRDHSSFSDGGWSTLDAAQALEPILVRSVGFLVKDDETFVVLVAHLTTGNCTAGEMCILKSDIVSKKELR